MRAIIAGLAATLFATNAMAADYLRGGQYEGGSASYNWAGVYIGAQIGYSEAITSLTTAPRTTAILPATTIETAGDLATWRGLAKGDVRGTSYGGFVGYNSQWGEIVLGLELNYNHSDLDRSETTTRIVDTAALTGVAGSFGQADYLTRARITDYATGRVRAGYAWNWAMPYAMAGLAVGRADITRSVAVAYTGGVPPGYLPDYTENGNRNGLFTFGYMAGFGVDVGLFPGAFLRGEYEYIQFNPIQGLDTQIHTFRVAAALKF
jgi:outer membrane immunogenic protein